MKVVRTITTRTTVIVDNGIKTVKTVVDQGGSKSYTAEDAAGAAGQQQSDEIDQALDEFDKSMESFDLKGRMDALFKDAFKPFDRLAERLRGAGRR
jgi:hypothetical protein